MNPSGTLNGIRVLLVEDDPDTREVLAKGLARHGARVFEAASAQVGMIGVETFRPHIMLLDIGLPDVDGCTLLEAVRRLPPDKGGDVPAVAITAHDDRDAKRRTLFAGFRLHLSKPVDAERLALIITGMLADER